ncbi:hypothetical protein AAE250_13380 [Bacteroides sp. GD17]|uniref:hypothetical protein n=1 Tax=Bacteroides sp. GD17 TaxID=3139826 RepID=UPI0025F0AA14|nr:hypothetical protein [uncultured Bacteroides sp.]
MMKKFTIAVLSAIFCGVVALSACGGAKKNGGSTESTESQGTSVAEDNAPRGYLMPAISVNDFCGDFTTMSPDYGYLMPEKGLFLKMNDIRGAYGIDVYTYVMDGDKIQCTPGHFVMITPRGGDKLEVTIKKSSSNNTPSFTFVPTPNCENSAYVATEAVAGNYYYLCGDGEARYKFEDLFEDERCAEFKNLVDNYGK